jgi:hypothetical protein
MIYDGNYIRVEIWNWNSNNPPGSPCIYEIRFHEFADDADYYRQAFMETASRSDSYLIKKASKLLSLLVKEDSALTEIKELMI